MNKFEPFFAVVALITIIVLMVAGVVQLMVSHPTVNVYECYRVEEINDEVKDLYETLGLEYYEQEP